MQAHAPPPGYFVRLRNTGSKDDLYLSKRDRMRRWLCCTCQVEEAYPSAESEHLKSPRSYGDGNTLIYHLMLMPFYRICDQGYLFTLKSLRY